jgi:hypothetical protein
VRSRLSVQWLNVRALWELGRNPTRWTDSQTSMTRRSTGTRLAARAYQLPTRSALPALHSAVCDRSPLVQRAAERRAARFHSSLEIRWKYKTARVSGRDFGEVYTERYSKLRYYSDYSDYRSAITGMVDATDLYM